MEAKAPSFSDSTMDRDQTASETALGDFYDVLQRRADEVSELMAKSLQSVDVGPPMRAILDYALVAPGKRVRSVMVLWTSELFVDKADSNALAAAVALEWVHTYSLIHDDLPAMDDDDYRRGRPTCHKVYGEAMAILAGDALLTAAFELLTREVDDSVLALRLIRELASAAGPAGMIAGQAADMGAEGEVPNAQTLEYVHLNKTAKLFRSAAIMGGICSGASPGQLDRLSEYGLNIGLAFQIYDDILDVSGSTEQLGKTAGKDERAGKITYPALFGMEQAKEHAQSRVSQALEQLADFGPRSGRLKQLGRMLVHRRR